MISRNCLQLFIFILSNILLTVYSFNAQGQQADLLQNRDSLVFYLENNRYTIDSNAEAINLFEKGKAQLDQNVLIYKLERSIKILSQNAINEMGGIVIPIPGKVAIRKVEGATYNMESGKVMKQILDKADVFIDKQDQKGTTIKFQLPSLKYGSILHYSLEIEIYNAYQIPYWNFQHEYPTLYSSYEIVVPDYYGYRNILRSQASFIEVKSQKELAFLNAGYFNNRRIGNARFNEIWVRRYIPAIEKEPFMNSVSNYEEQIKIQIIHIKKNGYNISLFHSWDQLSKRLIREKLGQFHLALKENYFLNDKLKELTSAQSNNIDKAKAIFAFVRDSFTIFNSSGATNLRNVFNNRKGSGEELNILLTAMLNNAGLNSDLVILSLKPDEPLNELYPNIEQADYLVSKVNISEKDYFLDASEKYLPFGILIPACYNGYSRVIGKKNYGITITPDLLVDKATTLAVLSMDSLNSKKMHLKVNEKLGTVNAYYNRSKWMGDKKKAKKELKNNFINDNEQLHLTNITIDNINEPDKPLIIHYDIEGDIEELDLIYMNPFFNPFFKRNPFPAMSRHFQVNLNYLYDLNYVFRFQVPEHYRIDDFPKSKVLKFGNNALFFQNLIEVDSIKNTISLSSRFKSENTSFPVESYADLRSFFEKMISAQNDQIVLKNTTRATGND